MNRSPRFHIAAVMMLVGFLYGCDNSEYPPISLEQATARNIFYAQILAGTQVARVASPSSSQQASWLSDTGWKQPTSATLYIALVRIDANVITAAVRYWAESIRVVDKEKMQAAEVDLNARFLRKDNITFMLISRFAKESDPGPWSYSYKDFMKNVTATPLVSSREARSPGLVTELESCGSDRWKRPVDGYFSCLLFIQDPSTSTDPIVNVKIEGVHFGLMHHPTQTWHFAKDTRGALFRFELASVPLIAMIEKGHSWPGLRAASVEPTVDNLQSRLGKAAVSFLYEIAIRVVAAVLLRSIWP